MPGAVKPSCQSPCTITSVAFGAESRKVTELSGLISGDRGGAGPRAKAGTAGAGAGAGACCEKAAGVMKSMTIAAAEHAIANLVIIHTS